MSELVALLDGVQVGVVRQRAGRLSFHYADSWRGADGAYPLSLSLPLASEDHGHSPVSSFLWGLLPDNERTLDRWAQRFRVSARNPFALLTHVGEDCAGAVQFASHERAKDLIAEDTGAVEWLGDSDVARRLRALGVDSSAGRAAEDTGQFSLAGAQAKTALYYDGRRWGVPSGRIPTTHILKPPVPGFDGHVENEHVCLGLAGRLGLPVARSEVRQFEDITVIVVERYDRVRSGRGPKAVRRVHQEDFCQALGKPPQIKYQNEGGPGPSEIAELIKTAVFAGTATPSSPAVAAADVAAFVDALIFNWLIGGTDAHAKNYSLLLGAGGQVRLAPLYDVASILCYPALDPLKAKLAMKVGGKYRLRDIRLPQWFLLAKELRVDEDELVHRLRQMCESLPDALAAEIAQAEHSGLRHVVFARLSRALTARARQCRM